VALLLPLLAAAPSAADAPYAVPRLGEPALGSDGDHLLEGAATAPAFAWFARLHAAYAYGAALADEASRVTGEAALGLGLPAGFEIAAGLPAGATFAAREAADPGAGDAPDGGRPTERLYRGLGDAGAGLGDLRLGLLWSRPAPGRGGFRWLLGFEATLPTGDHERLLGEDGPTWRPLLGATFEAFGARIAGNLGYRFRPEHVSVTDGRRFEQDDEFLWGLGVRFVREHDIAWSLEATGAVGTATADGPWPRAESRPVLAGGGVDWPVTRLWRLGLFAAAGIAGEEPPRFTAHLRVFGRPHQLDEDLDGVPRCRDDCPLLPGPGHNRGCPIPDSDGDGFPDDEDACPAVPAQAFSDDGC
jgi:hypothetical protein